MKEVILSKLNHYRHSYNSTHFFNSNSKSSKHLPAAAKDKHIEKIQSLKQVIVVLAIERNDNINDVASFLDTILNRNFVQHFFNVLVISIIISFYMIIVCLIVDCFPT